jgi:hypothetical protein
MTILKVRPVSLPQDHPNDYMRRLVVMLYQYLRDLASATNQVIDALATAGSGGGAAWTEAEIDFGSTPVYSASFTITDAAISATSKVQILPCGKAATGRTADDWEWDGAAIACNPDAGAATCYVQFTPGPVVGKRNIQYSVGA